MTALEARHLADLRLAEVSRALRALSSAYVERRERLSRGAALDGAGKRAAFALFYGPLHYLVTRHIVRLLGASVDDGPIVDVGCGTGAAGAAWALESRARPEVAGFDIHPWAVAEAAWTYGACGLNGQARRVDAARLRIPPRTSAVIAAYTVNELSDNVRIRLLTDLLAARQRGARLLIIEPVGRTVGAWFTGWRERFLAEGGRADEWRFQADLPAIVERLDSASGLNHRELTARSLYLSNP